MSFCLFAEHYKHERRKPLSSSIDRVTSTSYGSNSSSSSGGGGGGGRVDSAHHRHTDAAAPPLHSRHKRSMSWERNVEVLVVADYQMAGYHTTDLQHYVLTLMSIVSEILDTDVP